MRSLKNEIHKSTSISKTYLKNLNLGNAQVVAVNGPDDTLKFLKENSIFIAFRYFIDTFAPKLEPPVPSIKNSS